MKTVCFFSGDITRGGGTERAAVTVAGGLAARGGYRILVLSLTEQSEKLFFPLHDGVEHFALGDKWLNPGPGYLKVIPKLRHFLQERDIDVIVDIDIVLDVLSLPASRGLKTKVVSWEHFNCEYELTSLYRRFILKYSVKRTDYVVTLTDRDRVSYGEQLGRREHISVVGNPIPEAVEEDGAERENRLITVGNLVPVKGLDYLGQVAVKILKKHPDWKWLIVGEGSERAYLERLIQENNLQEQLILTGRVSDVASYLRRAKIFVLTSRREGLPMCLLEAMLYKLPAVSFDVATGPAEIMEDGVNGYLVKPYDCVAMADKLELLMENESLRQRFSENTHCKLERFQTENVLKSWNNILERLLGSGEAQS
ncbi:MAG: glycosyltransferase family 4 protein [Butyrivibrio sp.]|nr:glycosyltransferase family 4 protein [Acetatifactor muris]MCM1559260.1 glycosyltransferase family 4 protein [Butyrivibrio sp.]